MKPAEFDMDTGLKIGSEGVRIMKIYRENPLRPLTPQNGHGKGNAEGGSTSRGGGQQRAAEGRARSSVPRFPAGPGLAILVITTGSGGLGGAQHI